MILDKTSETKFNNFVGFWFFETEVLKSSLNFVIAFFILQCGFFFSQDICWRFLISEMIITFEVKCWGWYNFLIIVTRDRIIFGRIIYELPVKEFFRTATALYFWYVPTAVISKTPSFFPYYSRDSVPETYIYNSIWLNAIQFPL